MSTHDPRGLSPHFSRHLYDAIRLQAAQRFDQATYNQEI
jgi:hypothetical protein